MVICRGFCSGYVNRHERNGQRAELPRTTNFLSMNLEAYKDLQQSHDEIKQDVPMSGYLDAGTADRLIEVRFNCYRTPDSSGHISSELQSAHPQSRPFSESLHQLHSSRLTYHVTSNVFYFLKHRYTTLEPADHPTVHGVQAGYYRKQSKMLATERSPFSHAPLYWRPCVYRLHKLRVEGLTRASMASNRLCR
ncbi:hypothetical protein HBI25_150470 [Parastagonospora nodorum]|nr:hypothetical protein HBI10_145770 [Parastagonospora nodorum]KAH4019867.1 hypothetical protein HBI13_118920 [Parastagonospora nodorum]KAH4095597.1 hypothetical protein HBH48_045410 [Parastagonospora nodorum]KAH4118757.1 hypothetical protein HBH47_135700 [Parastagonospora nodorum]KAH4200772.1 hypothetical protein HBI95_167080 [Parastagonospora nodorum]